MGDLSNGTNYARIACLLMGEGTERMKANTLNNLPPRTTFSQSLDTKENVFKQLKRKGILTDTQYKILYPFNGDFSQIDMTLWMILARNVTRKESRRCITWNDSPQPHETTWAHDFIRLKEIRNYLFHASAPELNEAKFREIRDELKMALKRLGSDDTVIDDLLTRDLDPQQTSLYVMNVKQQYMEEKWQAHAKRRRDTKLLIVVLSILVFFVLAGMSILIYWYTQQKAPCSKSIQTLQTNSGLLRYMPRQGWGAVRPEDQSAMIRLKLPMKKAVVFHTAMVQTACTVTSDCCDAVHWLQDAQIHGKLNNSIKWKDIAYNYLIGDDGVVYEGRGSDYQGGAAYGLNNEIISIALLGNYVCVVPSRTMLMALYVFLEYLTYEWSHASSGNKAGPVLTRDYSLHGHCQVALKGHYFFDSPGAATLNEIRYWEHWKNDSLNHCNTKKDCLMSYLACCDPMKDL